MKPTIQRILVPTDFSVSSERAFEYAAALAGPLGASIHLVHVVHEPLAAQSAWEFQLPDAPEVMERMYQQAKSRLAGIAAASVDSGVLTTIEVRSGSPTEEINAAAIAYGTDLIVMGTHGRTGLPHLLLGSIAERVLRSAPCPVLAVRQSLVERDADVAASEAVPAW